MIFADEEKKDYTESDLKKVKEKLPPYFVSRLQKIYPLVYEKILTTFLERKPSTFRINQRKTNYSFLKKEFSRQGLKYREFFYPRHCFLLRSPLRWFQGTSLYQGGLVFLQNLSSIVAVDVFSPANGEKILDMCAAPGAKTAAISSYAPKAEIFAVEKNRKRFYKMLSILKQQGADNVKPLFCDALSLKKKFFEYFDKVLLDVPCSSEARFSLDNPKSFYYWKIKKIQELAAKQKKLIASSFLLLKLGGTLLYATCTFSPEENEEVVNWFLNKFKKNIEIIPIDINLKNVKEGLVKWEGKKFSPSLKLAKRIIPSKYMLGFFLAKFKKVA